MFMLRDMIGVSVLGTFPGAISILPGSTAQTFRNSTDVLGVNTGDYLAAYFKVGAGFTGATVTALGGWTAEYLLNDGGVTIGAALGSSGAFVAGSTTSFMGAYATAFTATAASVSTPVPFAGTAKNLCVNLGIAQPTGGSWTFTLVVNGSNTSVVITIPTSGVTGVYCDLADTASITANQQFYIKAVNASSSQSGTLQNWTMEILPSSGTPAIIGGSIAATEVASTTAYYMPFTNLTSATENLMESPMPRAGSITNLCVEVVTASANTTSATVMKNGSASGVTFNLANSTGVQCTTTGTPLAFAQGDRMSLRIVPGTSTQFALGGWSVNF
jgi:hypothetical protein